jgi:hypothetical protein
MNWLRALVCLFLLGAFCGQAGLAQTLPTLPTKATAAASPELVGQLTKQLSITPTQATGGAGALFGLAKSRLAPSDFGKVSDAVPGMHSFLEAAPSTGGMTGLSSLAGSAPGGIGGLAAAAGSFQKLGLSPDMVSKFVPIMTKYVEGTGGSGVASLLSGALK